MPGVGGRKEREGGREGETPHPRVQHPPRSAGCTQRAAGFTDVCYISMKGDGGRVWCRGVGCVGRGVCEERGVGPPLLG